MLIRIRSRGTEVEPSTKPQAPLVPAGLRLPHRRCSHILLLFGQAEVERWLWRIRADPVSEAWRRGYGGREPRTALV